MKINVHFRFSGFVGSERKNIFHKRVDSPLSSVTLVEVKKVVLPAGRKAPLWCHCSRKETAGRNKPPLFRRIVCEKAAAELAKSPPAELKVLKAAPHRAVRQFLRASFYHSAKIRLSRLLPLRETCWGVPSPNPAYAACAAKKFPSGGYSFSLFRPGNGL